MYFNISFCLYLRILIIINYSITFFSFNIFKKKLLGICFNSAVVEISRLYHINNLYYSFNNFGSKAIIQLVRHVRVLKILIFNLAPLVNESKYFLKYLEEDVFVLPEVVFSFTRNYPIFILSDTCKN